MRTIFCSLLILFAAVDTALAAPKTHVITFSRWQAIKADGDDGKPVELRVRALYVDGRLKEYTAGQPHDVTDRVFVVARVLRINDALPGEKQQKWIWAAAGWVQVDRSSGRITCLTLPGFESGSSTASWYRDYVAYCGVSPQNPAHVYAIVVQLGIRKPLLRKLLDAAAAVSDCGAPVWKRAPIQADFSFSAGAHATFNVSDGSLNLSSTDDEDSSD